MNRTLSLLLMLALLSLPLTKGAHLLSIGKSGLGLCCKTNLMVKHSNKDCCSAVQPTETQNNGCTDNACGSSCKGNAPCCLSFAGCLEKSIDIIPNKGNQQVFSTLENLSLEDFSQDIFQPPEVA
ncbi:MAG: hypothetical protein SFU91_13595 [Chloroherpetonaceae bacterium]|nr:hypothetical protein [Chloroherpetonaceae bacterium]